MTTVDLKNILIHKISGINDISFLNAIKTIVDSKSESMVYMTSQVQQKSIIEGREQIARGEFFTNEQIELEIDQWLKEE
jgi:predicted transcriptional regulator